MTRPVSPQEKDEGWSQEAKSGMAGYWRRLYDHIAGDHLTSVDLAVPPGRGLSFWGVDKGELFTKGNAVFSEIVWLVQENYLSFDQ